MQEATSRKTDRGRKMGPGRIAVCIAALVLAMAGCEGNKKSALTEAEIERLTFAQKPNRPDTLIVSGEAITSERITDSSVERVASGPTLREELLERAQNGTREQFMRWAHPRVRQRLNNEITSVVLYTRARRELGEKVDDTLEQMAETELRRFVLDHGGNNAQADEALKAIGRTRTTYKEWKKRQMLTEYAVSSKLARNRPITHSELLDDYDQMKDESFFQSGLVQFRLIDIQIVKVKLSDPNENPIDKAEALAQELLERIKAGADFGALAKEYSHGYRSAFGGLWKPRDPEAIARPYDVLVERAEGMEPGDVAGPIKTLEHIFIMKLEQKQKKGYRSLREVQDVVAQHIVIDRRREALKQLDTEVAQQASLADTDRFVDYCLEEFYRKANEPARDPK